MNQPTSVGVHPLCLVRSTLHALLLQHRQSGVGNILANEKWMREISSPIRSLPFSFYLKEKSNTSWLGTTIRGALIPGCCLGTRGGAELRASDMPWCIPGLSPVKHHCSDLCARQVSPRAIDELKDDKSSKSSRIDGICNIFAALNPSNCDSFAPAVLATLVQKRHLSGRDTDCICVSGTRL